MSDIYTPVTEDDEAFDPSEMTWIIQDGTAHIYCADDDEARAVADLVSSLCGASVERDGNFVYCAFELPFEGAMEMAEACGETVTEDEIIDWLEKRQGEAVRELESHGFNAEIQA